MALRTSKISSEIIQRCNRYLSNRHEASLKNKLVASSSNENVNIKPQRPFRYKIANTEKPQDLPTLNFNDNETPLFAELQPSADPEFRFDQVPQKWADTPTDSSPFPKFFRQQQSYVHATYSDKQKAEDKFIKYKMTSFVPHIRNFSTACSSRRYSSRSPADNNSKGNCKGKIDKCARTKKKECKVNQNKKCPNFKLNNCKQSKGSSCDLRYLDPNCVKKFAPYPSYSEACAEQLPDDPSECQQCPWRTCDDADTIEPGKPVRSRRHYSTCCYRHLEEMGGIVVSPHVSHPDHVQEYTCGKNCGVTKKPCKEPPGPCEVRKRKEEQKREEERKWRRYDEPKKKASDLNEHMVLSGIGVNDDIVLNPYTLVPVRITLNDPTITSSTSWIDIFDGPSAFLQKKEKPPQCTNKKKPKKPKPNLVDIEGTPREIILQAASAGSNLLQGKSREWYEKVYQKCIHWCTDNHIKDPNKVEIIEYGDIDWWSGRGKKTVLTEPEDPNTRPCRQEQCRKQHIRSKQDLLLVQPEMLMSKKGGKRIKGDEGHPLPCPDKTQKSKKCPKEPIKKPTRYGKRPRNVPYYKRGEE